MEIILCTVGPPGLAVKIMESINSSSVVVQWDEVDDSLNTTYVARLSNDSSVVQTVSLIEQSSYTITGLTLDIVYTITVTASNRCGTGPGYSTNFSLSAGITSAISATVTASLNPVSSAGYTTTANFNNIFVSAINNKPVTTNSKCLIVQHNDNQYT